MSRCWPRKGIVAQADADAIEEGLDRIEDEYEADGVPEDAALEDIHMHVEHGWPS